MNHPSPIAHLSALIALLLSTLLTFLSSAQIPNSGFELWAMPNSWNEEPVEWQTGNTQTTVQVSKDPDAFEGLYSMKVEAQPYVLGAYGYAETVFPISYIPASLDFYVKALNAYGSISVTIGFYNGDDLFQEFVWYSSDTIAEWTPVVLSLEQNKPVLTEGRIKIQAMVGDFAPGEAILWVDAMGFETIDANRNVVMSEMEIFPNPCNGVFYIQGASAGSEFRLADIAGRTLLSGRIDAELQSVETESLPPGIYFIWFSMADGRATNKVVVR